MKIVYQLLYKTQDNEIHDLIYEFENQALEDLANIFSSGSFNGEGKKIIWSVVVDRTLF